MHPAPRKSDCFDGYSQGPNRIGANRTQFFILRKDFYRFVTKTGKPAFAAGEIARLRASVLRVAAGCFHST
jgi:hypothetical protein